MSANNDALTAARMQGLFHRFSRGALVAEVDDIGLSTSESLAHQFRLAASVISATEGGPSLSELERRGQKSLLVNYGLAAPGGTQTEKPKPYAFAGGYAILPIHGILFNRVDWWYPGYVTGYSYLRALKDAALADPDVKAIILDVQSYGGEAAGCMELAAEFNAARDKKPILAFVDSACYSAAYALASQATRLSSIPSGGIGSIGVVAMHADMSKMLDNFGIKITFIKAGDRKTDGNPYEPLSKEAKAEMQARVDKLYASFLDTVAAGRAGRENPISRKGAEDTQARCYDADTAKSLGLIDAVETPADALAALNRGMTTDDEPTNPTGPTPADDEEDPDMSKEQGATDAAAARTEERTRISAITNHAEAVGRESLAKHLAFNTDMSVEQAATILAAASKTVAETPKEPERNALADAMNRVDHPNVGADATKADDGGKPSRVNSALALLAGTGVKVPGFSKDAPAGATH